MSPDGKIKKEIIQSGNFGPKPMEYAKCTVQFLDITNPGTPSEYLDTIETPIEIVIGEGDTPLDREIEKCIMTMNRGEMSLVYVQIKNVEVTFKVSLISFEFRGYYYQWSAEEKCKMALQHKEKGIELFRQSRYQDASHRFSKSLKLLLSIPVPIDEIPANVDGVSVSDLQNYRGNLYNNLASCYAKVNENDTVIDLCNKVLEIDEDNLKALSQRGFAYIGNRDFERAKDDLVRVLEKESDNKAVIEKLQIINANLTQQEANYASIVKKMFKS